VVTKQQQIIEQAIEAQSNEEGNMDTNIISTPITKAMMIRTLAEGGMSVAEIAKVVGVTYQHAYNTSKAAGEAPVTHRDSSENKSSKMREMHAKGMTTSQIAKALGVRYQFVHNVIVRTK
jgi:transposase